MIAISTTAIAALIVIALTIGWIVFAAMNVRMGRDEAGSEIELAPNRKPYYSDEVLEGRRLTMVQLLGVLLLGVCVVGLPLYWILEPSRQAGATEGLNNRLASWGGQLFETTANGGFNCAGCHGGMNATGGTADYPLADPRTGNVSVVAWKAPALDTALYRFSEDEVNFIITYGRPFSPMSPWGLDGGGPMNAQQVESLVAYIRSIQIPREGCLPEEADDPNCPSGHLPTANQDEIETSIRKLMDDEGMSYGEAVFNNPLASGAYSCARCHTQGWSYDNPGVTGQGAFGWNLTGGSTDAHFPNTDDMLTFISEGSVDGRRYGEQGQGSGRMPGFGAVLTDEQLAAVTEFVRSL